MNTKTKSEAARLVAAGLAIETFHHDTLGHFNVTALREMIQRNQPEEFRCGYANVAMVDGIECDALEYLLGHREVDPKRCAELTEEQLNEPLIFLECPPGSNGEQASQLLVDGIHRLVERRNRGYSWFDFFLIPLEQAPRIDADLCVPIPWGEKEVVPGRGLVNRKESEQ